MIINKKNFLKTVRIELGVELGGESPSDAYLILREPTTLEWAEIQDVANASPQHEVIKHLQGLFGKLIIEHNVYADEKTLYKPDELIDLLFGKVEVAMKIINDYIGAVRSPLAKQSDSK